MKMAIDLMPADGFVQSVRAGDPADVEPIQKDFAFLHNKFDNSKLLGGHTHDGTAGDAPKIKKDGLSQEVMSEMSSKSFKLRLIAPDVPISAYRDYDLLIQEVQTTWKTSPYAYFQTPPTWDGLGIFGTTISWRQAAETAKALDSAGNILSWGYLESVVIEEHISEGLVDLEGNPLPCGDLCSMSTEFGISIDNIIWTTFYSERKSGSPPQKIDLPFTPSVINAKVFPIYFRFAASAIMYLPEAVNVCITLRIELLDSYIEGSII
jgi:hypothetical protein